MERTRKKQVMGRFRLTDIEGDNVLSVIIFIFFIVSIVFIISSFVFNVPVFIIMIVEVALTIILILILLLLDLIREVIDKIKDKIKDYKLAKEIGWENVKKQKEEQAKKIAEEINEYCIKMGIDLNEKFVDSDKEERKARFKRFFE